MKNNRVLKTVKVADINVENEVVKVDLVKKEHLKHFNDLKEEYKFLGKFSHTPVITKDNQGVNCCFFIEVLKDLGVDTIEVEIIENTPLLNELQGINFRLLNLKLSNIERSELYSRKVKILRKLGSKGITKKISIENGVSQKTIQNSVRIDSIEEPLKEEIKDNHEDIGIVELKLTSKLPSEQQEEIKEELVKQRVENGTKVDNKGYKIILDKVKEKSILDNTDTTVEDTEKTEEIVEQTEKPKVKKEKSKKRDLMKDTIKFLIDTTQRLQKQQGEYDNSIFQEEFLKIKNHFNEIETYLTQSSNNTDFEQEKKVS